MICVWYENSSPGIWILFALIPLVVTIPFSASYIISKNKRKCEHSGFEAHQTDIILPRKPWLVTDHDTVSAANVSELESMRL